MPGNPYGTIACYYGTNEEDNRSIQRWFLSEIDYMNNKVCFMCDGKQWDNGYQW